MLWRGVRSVKQKLIWLFKALLALGQIAKNVVRNAIYDNKKVVVYLISWSQEKETFELWVAGRFRYSFSFYAELKEGYSSIEMAPVVYVAKGLHCLRCVSVRAYPRFWRVAG